jgi:hypothetical protein
VKIRRHKPSIVTKRLKLATEMMGTDAGFHPDQAGRQVGEPRFHLAARPLLAQHDCAAIIKPNNVKRVLADTPRPVGQARGTDDAGPRAQVKPHNPGIELFQSPYSFSVP